MLLVATCLFMVIKVMEIMELKMTELFWKERQSNKKGWRWEQKGN